MKEPIPEANHDIDAGWDDIAPTTAPVAAKPIGSQPPEVGDLDAGWEIEVPSGASFRADRKAAKVDRKSSTEHAQPLATSQVTLTKKARRELERQNKIHEAKRRAEAKLRRKEQRRVEDPPVGDASPVVGKLGAQAKARKTADQNGRARAKKKDHAKPDQKQKSKSDHARVVNTSSVKESRSAPSPEGISASSTSAGHVEPTLSAARSRKIWLFSALLLVAFLVAAFRWFR
jgi:hypothetical protein